MSATPFFSVIIPTYNRCKHIGKAVISVLNQSFKDFELIIIDDASTDITQQIIETFEDNRIVYLKNESNQERCKSRNKGMEIARGNYYCFLDSDDWYKPNFLAEFYQAIQEKNQPPAVFFCGAFNYSDGKESPREKPVFTQTNPYTFVLRYTFAITQSCIHHSIAKKHKLDSDIIIAEDMDYFIRLLHHFPFYQLNSYNYVYHLYEGNFSLENYKRSKKELVSFKKIFSKPENKGKLPLAERNRLLSMCYFHLACYYGQHNNFSKTWINAIKSFLLYRKGYNGNTNKILLVNMLYNFPVIGVLCGIVIKKLKN